VADKIFPLLFAKSSTGKIKVWQIRAESVDNEAKIVTNHGYVDSEELQSAEVKVTKGKNIGKKNETTPFEQACSQAESKWNKKKDKKYVEDPSGDSDILLPMLAHTFSKRKHDLNYPALAQPKLNGIRCLAKKISDEEMVYTSREAKIFSTLEHLTPDLLKIMKVKQVLDGELFTRELTFQQITSAVKRLQDNTDLIQLWVYDIVDSDTPFDRRLVQYLKMVEKANSDRVVSVTCEEVKSDEEVMVLHDRYYEAAFEGIMIRNREGLYKETYRSKDLQKHKNFIDDEFEIIGYHDGEGKDEGAVTWICVTKDGEEFDCTPNGTYPQRYKWWEDRKKYIGKMLTVRYQNLSDDRNVPVFPKGIVIRDYE
jgi:ATP-dependent DNA ligase